MHLRLEHHQVAQLLQHAASRAPQEACGLLGGEGGKARRMVSIDNVATDASRRFEMDASQLVRACYAFEREGLELCAIWHSHPVGKPLPSAEDIRAAAWPDVCQLIVGFSNGKAELGAWRIASGEAKPRAPANRQLRSGPFARRGKRTARSGHLGQRRSGGHCWPCGWR